MLTAYLTYGTLLFNTDLSIYNWTHPKFTNGLILLIAASLIISVFNKFSQFYVVYWCVITWLKYDFEQVKRDMKKCVNYLNREFP